MMGAFFLNPALLAFTALASLPILIHLLNRQRYKRVRWAAMEFLLAAYKKTYRRVRLENLLLLILRTAAVLLAALALARPFSAGGTASLFREPVSATLLVDDSLSMSCRTGGASRMERGKTMLRGVVDGLPSRSLVTLVLGTRASEPVIKDAGIEEAQEAVAALTPTDAAVDMAAALVSAAGIAKQAPLSRKELIVLTDLQASSCPLPKGLDPALQALAKAGVPVRVLDAGDADTENVALTDIRLLSKVPVAGRPLRVEGRLKNFGTGTRQNLEALLVVDGVTRDRQVLNRLEAGAEGTVTLFATLPEPSAYGVEIRLAEDALGQDDHRYLGLRATAGLEVLLIDGDPKPSPEDCETFFLARALSPEGSHSPIHVTERSIIRFGPDVDLRAYAAVALLNVGALEPAQMERIESYVRDGGHLIVSFGNNTAIGEWNERGWKDGKGFLPVRLKEVRGPSDPAAERFAHLKLADPSHLAAATLKSSRNLEDMNVRRFIACETARDDPTTRIPWVYSVDDLPAVVDRPFGSGRVIVVTTALDKEWGDMPVSFDYVPLAQDLVYAAVQGAQSLETLVGRPMTLEVGAEHGGESLRVVSPDEKTERVAAEPLQARLRVATGPLAKAGLYRLSKGNPEDVLERFAANVDPRESDLARVSPEALKQALPGLTVEVVGGGSAGKSGEGKSGHEYWRPFLMAVGIILGLESFLAWRFGRE